MYGAYILGCGLIVADNVPRKGGRVQTQQVCCHCYSDDKLHNDAYIDIGMRGEEERIVFQFVKIM